MTTIIKRVIQIVACVFIVLFLLLIFQIDSLVLQCIEAFFPGFGPYVCLILVCAELLGGYFLYHAWFGRSSKLLLKENATPREREEFTEELKKRLSQNPEIKAQGLDPNSQDFVLQALKHLDQLALAEIKSQGRKVFLATALSQNGRLDALIMFFSLCRMVWRISKIYNQKPTPEEVWALTSTVTSSTFVAFSIEALDIPQTITEAMHELVPSVAPAMAASSVPVIGSAVHIFTASLLDGAANCLLAVRAGVITKRAYTYAVQGGTSSLRSACIKETAGILLEITHESVGCVAKALKREIQDLSVDSGKNIVNGASKLVGQGAQKAVETVKSGANYVSDGVKTAANKTIDGVADLASDSARVVTDSAQKAVASVKSGASYVSDGVKSAASKTIDGVTGLASDSARVVTDSAQKAVETVKSGASYVSDGVKSAASKTIDGVTGLASDSAKVVTDSAHKAVETVKSGASYVSDGVKSAASKTIDGVTDFASDSAQKALATVKAVGATVNQKQQEVRGFVTKGLSKIQGLFGSKRNA